MAVGRALLFTALCGVHSASIPANSLGSKLASKSASMLDKRDSPNLDKIRRSVLEDMKRLLDTQLAALFESAVKQKAGAQSKGLKLKTQLHPTSNTGNATPLESAIPDEPQNSDLIKVLTDGSLQDPGDEVLRNAVDQILQEDEDEAADSIEKVGKVLYRNDDQLNGDNSTRNNNDAFDDALINSNDRDRQKDDSNNRRGISHVIIEHVPKNNKKNDDNEKPENILDLDEILKSAVKDLSTSEEDERSKSIDLENTGSFTHSVTESIEPRISNFSKSKLRIHDPDNNSFQVGGLKNVNIDEMEQPSNSEDNEKSDNGALEARSNSVIEPENLITQHHKHSHKHGKKYRDRQPIKQSYRSEKNRNNGYDVQKAGEDLNDDDNDKKALRNGENDDNLKTHQNERQRSKETSRKHNGNNENHRNIKQHSRHRHNINHDKHEHHNGKKKHDHVANQHVIVRLISDSDGSNESSLDNMNDKKPTHKKTIQSTSSDSSKKRHHDSKETSKNTINEVKVPRDDSEDENNLAEIQNLSINETKNSIEEDTNIIKKNEYNSEEKDYLIESSNDANEESNLSDDEKQVGGDKKTPKTVKNEIEKIENDDDVLFENEATEAMEAHREKNKARETGDIDTNTKIRDADENDSEDNKVVTKKNNNSKKDETHCHHERNEQMNIETDQLNVIRDLMQNKEMQKSYSLSLTLSTK